MRTTPNREATDPLSRRSLVAVWCLLTGTLAACGGGGGGGGADPVAPAPVAPPTVAFTGKAVDGPLQGATACYDLNDNGACDTGEPTSGPTDANGNFSFDVLATDAGKHRVVVQVPATAIDKDTGAAVGTAFTLTSPATGASGAQSVFASPLTTLVQAQMDATGATASAASDYIKTQAGLSVSPLADFTASTTTGNTQAATVARLVQVTALQQGSAVASVVGKVDVTGATVTQKQLDKSVLGAVIAALPTLAAQAADPAVASATGSALQTALKDAAAKVVAQASFTPEDAIAAVGIAKLPPDAANVTPEPFLILTSLSFTDVNTWFYRVLAGTKADDTPDANNIKRYYSVFKQSSVSAVGQAPAVNTWGNNSNFARAGDVHWTGTTWSACPLGTRGTSTIRDALGRSTYDYCHGYEKGASVRSAVDVSGQSIRTVFSDTIRKFPGYAAFGPADLNAFGTETFPTGSKLYYQSNTVTDTQPAYDVQANNVVSLFSTAVGAGGDTRTTTGLACAGTLTQTAVTSLEDMIQKAPGKPCVFNVNTTSTGSSLSPNEWWGGSTLNIGTLTGAGTQPTGTGDWYTTNVTLRVGFTGAGNATTYYRCYVTPALSTRNCTSIGTGTYAIQTLADGRIMTFTSMPSLTTQLTYDRVFIERGGKVYYGFKNRVGTVSNQIRMNTAATNAVFNKLGIPGVTPE